MSDTFGSESSADSRPYFNSPSLEDILKLCVKIGSYDSLLLEDKDLNEICLPVIIDYSNMITPIQPACPYTSNSSNGSEDSFGGVVTNDSTSTILEENGRISLAYENLRTIPRRIADKFATQTRFLDLSHNNFQNLSFLLFFEDLHTLLLDRNTNLDVNTLPFLPNLKILWINNCNITNITDWIHRIDRQCPSLEHLSVMGNPGIKTIFNYSTLPVYSETYPPTKAPTLTTDYREYILHVLPNLKYLDGMPRSALISLTASLRNTLASDSPPTNNESSTSESNKMNQQKQQQQQQQQQKPKQHQRKSSPTLSFKDLFRLRQRKKSFNSSSTN